MKEKLFPLEAQKKLFIEQKIMAFISQEFMIDLFFSKNSLGKRNEYFSL
jgi:hypothetical protein